MSSGKKATLSTGQQIPLVGYGTWQAKPGEVKVGVLEALKVGYRHLDLALVYENQPEVAQALKQAYAEIPGLKREDIFITSKLWNTQHRPEIVEKALDECLAELEMDYLDLYLVHFPISFAPADKTSRLFPRKDGDDRQVKFDTGVTISQTWEAMTKLPKSKARAVGVSNFTQEHIDIIIKDTGVVPAALQIERHPRLPQWELLDYCKQKNIHVTAYSAFGNNQFDKPLLLQHEAIKLTADRLSKKAGKEVTPAQVIIAWAQVGGHSVIPKSVTPSRIKQNFEEIELDDEALAAVNKLGENPERFNVPIVANTPFWDINVWNDEKERHATYKVITKLES